MTGSSLLDEFRSWDARTQQAVADRVADLSSREVRVWYCKRGRTCDGEPHDDIAYRHARDDQWPPLGSNWLVWFLRGGRGSGKTRTASEFVRKCTNRVPVIACIGIDTRRIRQTMIEGRSGLIRICEAAGMDYTWEPSKREFTFGNGAKAMMYSAEEPDSLRGPEHGLAWLDEPSHYPLIEDVWSNLQLGLRVQGMPGGAKIVCTSTPLPNAWTKRISADEGTRVTVVPTHKNLVNLDPAFAKMLREQYEDTRLGRQELYGEILDDVIGALWSNSMIQYVERDFDFRSLDRIVTGVDPSGSSDAKRDETGIVTAGVRGKEFFVLDDGSGHYTPHGWAERAMKQNALWQGDAIVAEKNFGGQMVESTIHNEHPHARVLMVNSRRGKRLRAEPIVGRYEQRRVFHASGLGDLEDQMTSWVPATSQSPDRVDALVHALTELGAGSRVASVATPLSITTPSTLFDRR